MLVPLTPELGDIIIVMVGVKECLNSLLTGIKLAVAKSHAAPLNFFASVYINHCVESHNRKFYKVPGKYNYTLDLAQTFYVSIV